MATLHITEFRGINTHEQAAPMPPIAEQAVTYTTSTASATLNAQTGLVRLIADADAYIEIAGTPTATTTNMLLPSKTAEYFVVPRNSSLKIAAYDGTS